MKKLIVSFLLVGMMSAPLAVSAQVVDPSSDNTTLIALYTQLIQTLEALILQLQAGTSTPPTLTITTQGASDAATSTPLTQVIEILPPNPTAPPVPTTDLNGMSLSAAPVDHLPQPTCTLSGQTVATGFDSQGNPNVYPGVGFGYPYLNLTYSNGIPSIVEYNNDTQATSSNEGFTPVGVANIYRNNWKNAGSPITLEGTLAMDATTTYTVTVTSPAGTTAVCSMTLGQ